MIERSIVQDKFNEYNVSEFIKKELNDVPIKEISLEKNPLGERIIIYTSAPGLVIGREGSNIKRLTEVLREQFNLENLQIKIGEVDNMFLSAKIVARRIANDLANFGSQKFRLTGFKAVSNIMNAGAMGVEIRITGKLPAARAKSWRFSRGYLKKTGYVSDFLIDKAIDKVTLKTGVVGIKVSIMLPNTPLPDKIEYLENVIPADVKEKIEKEVAKETPEEVKVEKKEKEVREKKVETPKEEKSKKTTSSKKEAPKKEAKAKEVKEN